MAIDNLMFALHVADQRKKLIENLKDKGINLSEDISLAGAVDNVKKLGIQEHKPAEGNGWKVTYFDIDGTILKEEYVVNGGTPNPPIANYDNERLKFVGWADLPEIVTHNSYPLAIYETIEDITYIDIIATEDKLNYTLKIYYANSSIPRVTIDWGDGTIDTNSSHIYSSAGEYTIKIFGTFSQDVVKGPFVNYMESIRRLYYTKEMQFHLSSALMKGLFYNCVCLEILVLPQISIYDYSSFDINTSYLNKIPLLKTLYSPKNFKLYQGFLSGASNLERACIMYDNIITDNVINGASYIKYLTIGSWNCQASSYFYLYYLEYIKIAGDMECYGIPEIYYLDTIAIDEGVSQVAFKFKTTVNPFNFPSTLKSLKLSGLTHKWEELVLPEGLETLEFTNSYRLKYCHIPDSLKGRMPSFSSYHLKKLKIPTGITSLNSNFLASCKGIEELIIMPNKLLSLSNTFKTTDDGIIWVNDEVIEQYKTATNWSAHADKMRPLSEKPID